MNEINAIVADLRAKADAMSEGDRIDLGLKLETLVDELLPGIEDDDEFDDDDEYDSDLDDSDLDDGEDR